MKKIAILSLNNIIIRKLFESIDLNLLLVLILKKTKYIHVLSKIDKNKCIFKTILIEVFVNPC